MRELYMSDEEITRSYRGASDKKAQVSILADLNAVDKRVIHNKLLALGLIDGEPIPEKSKGGRPKMVEIDEAEARRLIEKDVPDEQIAKHFGVGVTTFRTWRREKGIMRYSMRKRTRKTVEEVQKMSVPILDVKQREEKPAMAAAPTACQPAKPVDVWSEEKAEEAAAKETPVKVAEDADGMTAAALSDLLATLDKLGEAGRVTVGGKVIRSVFVGLRFDGKNGDTPAEMTVELET